MNLSGVDPNLSLELLIGLEALKFSTSIRLSLLSKPQLNHNSTQPNITLTWVRHENDFAHHPTNPPPHKLNFSNISAVTDPILMKL